MEINVTSESVQAAQEILNAAGHHAGRHTIAHALRAASEVAGPPPVALVPEAPDLSHAVIVGPNDHLILGFRNASAAQLVGLRESIREKHPQISDRIVIANGPDTVAVIQTNGEKE